MLPQDEYFHFSWYYSGLCCLNLSSRCSSSKYPQKVVTAEMSSKAGVLLLLLAPFACCLSSNQNERSCLCLPVAMVLNVTRSDRSWCMWLFQKSQHASVHWTWVQSTHEQRVTHYYHTILIGTCLQFQTWFKWPCTAMVSQTPFSCPFPPCHAQHLSLQSPTLSPSMPFQIFVFLQLYQSENRAKESKNTWG